ncbi:MAG: hypothetical protein LBV69_07860, partial [Bacteroidales bacterium]|nr:hypothetical protein [Bacteroidales bacterium]
MNDFSPHISKKIFLVVLMSAFFVNVYSQDEKEEYKLSSNVWFLGVDASVNSIYTDDNIHIMENLRDVYSYNYVSSKAYGSNFGINTEYRLLPRFGIITGLRYTLLQKNYSSNDFMYFNYKNDENGVYYAKLTDIKENIHFVTVPVSFKFLAHSAKYFGINIKLDFDFNFRVASSYRIGFEDEEMVSTKKEIK